MGFLSILGKIADIGTDFIPGVSGVKKGVKLAGDIAGAAGSLGSVLGKQQGGAAQGKFDQATLNQRQDQNALAKYIAEQNAQTSAANTDLQRKSFETNNRSSTAKQALIGALLGGGVAPTSATASGTSGGLLRSLNGNPEAMAAMKMLGSQGSAAQSAPLQFQGGNLLTAPALSRVPQIDQGGFLSTLAKIGELAGAASPYLQGLGDPGQSTAGSVARTPPQLAGVTPFLKPPTAKFSNEPDIYGGVY